MLGAVEGNFSQADQAAIRALAFDALRSWRDGDAARAAVDQLGDGQCLLLENLRYHRGEEKNDPDFARALAALCDDYVDDAFGTAHRAHASTAGMVPFAKRVAAGDLLRAELLHLRAVLEPARPLLVVLGGAKVSDKLAVLEALAPHADVLAIGVEAVADSVESIAIGKQVQAYAVGAVTLGYKASTGQAASGSFVFGDRSTNNTVASFLPNEFVVRAAGGTSFFSNPGLSSGVKLAAGANAWSSLSDVNSKERFRDLDGDDVLAKLAAMSIREWSYKAQDAAIRHVGPTAQDFHAAFGLGEDPLRISTIDADGIALAGVSALARENTQRVRENAERVRENAERVRENQELRELLAATQAELAALRELVTAVAPKR